MEAVILLSHTNACVKCMYQQRNGSDLGEPKYPCFNSIDLFTLVCLVAWPLNESEAGLDLVLIETSLLLLC